METLFTPWRYDYLVAPKEQQVCIFCEAGEGEQAATLTLFRSREAVVMLNRYPYTNGHLMIAPVEHESRLFESSPESLMALIRLTAESQRILSQVYAPAGFNVGMNFGEVAGAGFAGHYHMHVVPRWGGDVNFMTVTGDTRMIPENLDVTYQRLKPWFSSLSLTTIE